ncbi:MAG TPA: OB-fold domain-containing protein [Arenicellales bacterium]|jgi:hypothetical protein|nr:hypothetical protein [Gammaproteobacteria bacterium]MDP6025705.1 OB-fold domain-containing protein [Pseudomonadales bacterium]HJL51590.1 OB-fold domain-containing protein [Arenicellales bacterium]MDP6314820.1 OB-fold domain-containing protein [Pseudomonadales bacterium]MDP7313778.1 OB-fold domain-containing protein [Pseudomonadales bacterium]|tara:strand:- start:14202 stop:14717 length:516 start_codon:yes stop_codon:yes gene_type:complete
MVAVGEYLGMPVNFDGLDKENVTFFRHCGSGQLHLQCCDDCGLKRYPPTTACPFCASPAATWEPVEGLGTLYSYAEVHHAIQPAFKAFTPYLLLLVELDEQRNLPDEFDGLRLQGNLVTPTGDMASPVQVERVGIGMRLRVVYKDLGDGFALPQWMIDEDSAQPEVWRYPE